MQKVFFLQNYIIINSAFLLSEAEILAETLSLYTSIIRILHTTPLKTEIFPNSPIGKCDLTLLSLLDSTSSPFFPFRSHYGVHQSWPRGCRWQAYETLFPNHSFLVPNVS